MKQKIILFILLVCCVFCFNNKVNALTMAKEGDTDYNDLKNAYENASTISVNSSGDITLYGMSDCSTSSKSCTYKYQSNNSSLDSALKNLVKCTNGEKYIIYQSLQSYGAGFKEDNSNNYDGKVYWTESYFITCTNDSTQSNSVGLTSSSSDGVNNQSNTNGGYSSSTTVDNENTGVNTYYMVLGIIVILSFLSIKVIKKYNLFKSI